MLNTTKYQEPRAPINCPAPAVNCAIFSRLEKLPQLRRLRPMSCIYRPFAWPSLLSALIVLLCTASLYAAPPDKNPFGLDDYSALHRARALAVAPDGKMVLFVTTYDGEKAKPSGNGTLSAWLAKTTANLSCRIHSSRRALLGMADLFGGSTKSRARRSWGSCPWRRASRRRSSRCRTELSQQRFRPRARASC